MADDKHYVPGDFYRIDDNSGFKIRARHSRKQWNTIITAPEHFNPRQPQDLVTGVRDDQAVPDPRPRQVDQFVIIGSWVIAPAPRLSTEIVLASTAKMQPGDTVQIMLDVGEIFRTKIVSVTGNVLELLDQLPGAVGGPLGDPIENQVLDLETGPAVLPTFILDSPVRGILNRNYLG